MPQVSVAILLVVMGLPFVLAQVSRYRPHDGQLKLQLVDKVSFIASGLVVLSPLFMALLGAWWFAWLAATMLIAQLFWLVAYAVKVVKRFSFEGQIAHVRGTKDVAEMADALCWLGSQAIAYSDWRALSDVLRNLEILCQTESWPEGLGALRSLSEMSAVSPSARAAVTKTIYTIATRGVTA